MKIILNVPRFKQKKNTCGPSSLQQILAYYGIEMDLKKIMRNVKIYKGGFAFMSDLATYVKKLGFDSKIICYDASIVDPTWSELSKRKIIQKLVKRFKFEKNGIKKLIKFLKVNGKLEIRIPTKELILSYLKKKVPPIICLSSTILRGKSRRYKGKYDDIKGNPIGHFLVISGYDNGYFIVTDPSRISKGIYKVKEDKLLFSWFFWGGWLLIIKPKRCYKWKKKF